VEVPAPAEPAKPAGTDREEVDWMWPVKGKVLSPFSEASKGVDIGGRKGAPVVAAASGRVVYAGAGLRGYGKLVIIKHNNTWLSAYAHNENILVKEQQDVRKGQKIAEMGQTDADQVKLHFEVRREGKPVDPAKVLPGM
jgi:lipoprotein NlpD